MTKIKKMEIIERIKGMSNDEQSCLKSIINRQDCLIYQKHYISFYKGGKWSHREKVTGYYLRMLLDCKVENDAPKGGQDGDYIIVKNIKANKEAIEFARKFLEIYL